MSDVEKRSRSQHVGPIIFGNRTARSQLLNHGEVVTFRTSDRTTGDTWWRKSRTGPKQGDVRVELIKECRSSRNVTIHENGVDRELEPYVDKSGFETLSEWLDAIGDISGHGPGYLYRVTAKEGVCGRCGEERPLSTNEFCPPCMRAEASELDASREAKGHAR